MDYRTDPIVAFELNDVHNARTFLQYIPHNQQGILAIVNGVKSQNKATTREAVNALASLINYCTTGVDPEIIGTMIASSDPALKDPSVSYLYQVNIRKRGIFNLPTGEVCSLLFTVGNVPTK